VLLEPSWYGWAKNTGIGGKLKGGLDIGGDMDHMFQLPSKSFRFWIMCSIQVMIIWEVGIQSRQELLGFSKVLW